MLLCERRTDMKKGHASNDDTAICSCYVTAARLCIAIDSETSDSAEAATTFQFANSVEWDSPQRDSLTPFPHLLGRCDAAWYFDATAVTPAGSVMGMTDMGVELSCRDRNCC